MVSGDPIQTYLGHSGSAAALAFYPLEALLVSGSENTAVHAWNLAAKPQLIVMKGNSGSLAFSLDGKRLTSGNSAWSAVDGTVLYLADGKARRGSPAFSSDGEFVANGPGILNATSGTKIAPLEVKESGSAFGSPYGVSFSPDGKRIASGGPEGVIKIWSIE